jgi:hypothetical protein
MPRRSRLRREEGLALVAVLLLMLVLTLLGGAAFVLTATDLKIGVNAQQQVGSLYAAEAGVQSLLAFYRGAPGAFFQKQTGGTLPLPEADTGAVSWEEYRIWLAALRYDPAPLPRYVELTVQAREPLSRAAARVKAVIAHNPLPGPFQIGLVSAGRVQLSGAVLQTGIHANAGYVLDPAQAEELRQKQHPLSQSVDPAAADYRPPLPQPFLTPADLAYFRNLAGSGQNLLLNGNRELFLTGNQQGRLIFVEGDVQVQGVALSGVTLVATGAITLAGSTSLNPVQQIDTALIAGRDVILKQEGPTAGVFWAGGSFVPEGFGELQGMVISQGGIQAGPSFRFRRNDQIDNPYLPPPSSGPRFVLKGWLQL